MNKLLDLNTLKLAPPSTARPLMEREQVLRKLSSLGAFRLVLLRAPAGYGKTSLMRMIRADASAAGGNVAWLTFDSSDNDPARLLLGMRAALLVTPEPPQDNYVRLGDTRVTHLFLDDVELLDTSNIALVFTLIADVLPAPMSVFIGARSLRGHSVAALKANGALLELDMEDLQFSQAETASYLQRAQFDLSAADVALLQRTSEGWPAAVELIGLAWKRLQGRGHVALPQLPGLRDLGEYLAEEVFEAQSDDIKEFLIATAALSSFHAELADCVRASGDSARLIAAIRAAGLPIQPLQNNWFRYHPLFAEHIVLHHRPPPAIYVRAAEWLTGHGYAFEAIDYFLKGGEYEQAADTLESIVGQLRLHGQFPSIIQWCDQLPDALLKRRPALTSALVVGMVYSSRRDDLARWLDYFRQQAGKPDADPLYGEGLRALDPVLAFLDGDTARTIALADRDWPQQRQANPNDRATLAYVAAYTCLWRGMLDEAAALLIEARRACRESGTISGLAIVYFLQAYLDAIQGNFDAALQQLAAIDALAQRHSDKISPALLYPFSAGLILLIDYERNALGLVASRLTFARSLIPLGLPWDSLSAVSIVQARMLAIKENPAAATRWLEGQIMQGHPRSASPARAALEGELSRMAIQTVRPESVAGYAALLLDASWPGHERCIVSCQEIDGAGIVQARLMIHAAPGEALARIGQLLAHALAAGRLWRATKLRVLLAIALQRSGLPKDAQRELALALEQAARSGMVRSFLDEGPDILPLLAHMQAKSRHLLSIAAAAHLDAVLRAGGAATDAAPPAVTLTQTEYALLSLVAQGKSNQEIGANLFLSVSTVKWHLGQIFRKLDAGNRGQAVFNARQLGLLPQQ
ncbi:hypothetical protein IGS61_12320 [Janthinobacterium sp. FW305-129]|uniref:LuxR C-terminal-related transcriptional regulator n=1 Tax=Janthinobacterium sp. FW305-129 TaxID=2775054 RepID=UPI001E31694F|nr:LuxR C-terminal-related transcriptional regulator [Janthinobacterium sp. FW305-129]MCC7598277.1 hypothetical protein [Janthinobacterium sp. FW305-129]